MLGFFLQLELCRYQAVSFSLPSKAICGILTSTEEVWGDPDSVK